MIKNCSLTNNTGFESLFDISMGRMSIINVIMKDNFNNIFAFSDSTSKFESVFIKNHKCVYKLSGCFLSANTNSKIQLNKVYSNELYSENSFGNIYSENSSLFIDNSAFSHLNSFRGKGSCIFQISSNLNISNSFFDYFFLNCLISTNSYFSVNNSFFDAYSPQSFDSINVINFGIIYLEDNLLIEISNSKLICSKNARYGGALYIFSSRNLNFIFENLISNNSFIFNEVLEEGGSVFVYDSEISIVNNIFAKNRAKNGGGGVFLSNVGLNLFIFKS